MIRKKASLVTIVLSALVVVTLLAAGATPAQAAETKLKPKYGGTLIINGQEAFSLGYPPAMTGTTDGQQSSVCLETFFRFDEKGGLVPLLATGWKADAKAGTITVSLRKGVKFHDGTDFNAKVAKWNLDKFREGKRPELKKVTSVDVVDDYTVRLNLSKFDNVLLSQLAMDPGRQISPTAFEKNGQAWCEKNPVGTGPWQFVSWQRDVAISFKRFDGYWGGKPYLDGVVFKKMGDPVVDILSYKSGTIHMLSSLDPKEVKALEKAGLGNIALTPEGQITALAPNSKDPKSPFADLRVRQALAYAINPKEVSDAFGYGYWKVLNQWEPPGAFGHNPAVRGYPYNPKKAKELLAAAGYPNGFKTTIHFYALQPIYMDEMVVFQRQLKDVGIDVALDGVQRPRFSEMASLGKGWEGIVRTQGYAKPDVLAYLAQIAGGIEFSEIARPQEFLDLYTKATTTPDMAQKKKLTQELMSLAVEKQCMVAYMYTQPMPIVKTKKLHDDLMGVVWNRYLSPKAWLE